VAEDGQHCGEVAGQSSSVWQRTRVVQLSVGSQTDSSPFDGRQQTSPLAQSPGSSQAMAVPPQVSVDARHS